MDQQTKDLPALIKGCRDVLNDADQYIHKNQSLGTRSSDLGSKTQKAWRKLKWDATTVNALRDRMVANAIYLNAFNTSLARSVYFAKYILGTYVTNVILWISQSLISSLRAVK